MSQKRLPPTLKKTHASRVAAGLVLACLLLAACAGKGEIAARRGLTAFNITPQMTVYLPDGWRASDPTNYGAAMDALHAKVPLALSPRPDAPFYATRTAADGEVSALLTLGRAASNGLTNDLLGALTSEEKQRFTEAMNIALRGVASEAGIPITVSSAAFRQVGRYEPVILSGRSVESITFDSVFYFLPGQVLALSYVHMSGAKDATDRAAEFTRILAAFEPDAAYKPKPPPARNPGEPMLEYLLRAGCQGDKL